MIAYCGPLVLDHLVRLERLPVAGEFLKGELVNELVGGCMPNSAIQSALLGVETLLVSKLGDDQRGEQARHYLASTPGLQLRFTHTQGVTPLALVLLTPGERTIIATEGDSNMLGLPDADVAADLARAGHVMIDIRDPQVCAAYHRLVSGVSVLPLRRLSEQAGHGLKWQIVVGSANDGEPAAAQLEAIDCRLCVVTEGSAGGRWWRPGDGWAAYPAAPALAIVDSTGAGDCFAAGLLAGLDGGHTIEKALDLATRCGADVCGLDGGHPH